MNLSASIDVQGRQYELVDLTIFGFETSAAMVGLSGLNRGVLRFGENRLGVEFRIRQTQDERSICSFANLTLSNQRLIEKYIGNLERVGAVEALEARSYDELAEGLHTEAPAESAVDVTSAIPQRSWQFKSLAMAGMMIAMIALMIMALVFMRSRSSLSISNAALVGNFLPVNAKIEGEILDVFVSEGQQVRKGDLMLRLKNPEIESVMVQTKAKRDTAKQKVDALRKQLKNYEHKMVLTTQKISLDLEVAQSELELANKTKLAAKARADRMLPYVESGSITQLEYDEVQEELLAAEALVIATQNQVRQLKFSQQAVKDGILILGDRLDDENGRITTDLEIAEAELAELEIVCQAAANQVDQLAIVAPRDGQVYTTYRQRGEFLKIADQVAAISFPGKTWVAGHVTPYQASRVRPGQPVAVSFPSLGMNLEGVVLAVGHRAMYSKGGYNADFRGMSATDVPIKVQIDDLPIEIPSGIRVEMAVSTGFGIEWIDNFTGFELKPIFNEPTAEAKQMAAKASPSVPAMSAVPAINPTATHN